MENIDVKEPNDDDYDDGSDVKKKRRKSIKLRHNEIIKRKKKNRIKYKLFN